MAELGLEPGPALSALLQCFSRVSPAESLGAPWVRVCPGPIRVAPNRLGSENSTLWEKSDASATDFGGFLSQAVPPCGHKVVAAACRLPRQGPGVALPFCQAWWFLRVDRNPLPRTALPWAALGRVQRFRPPFHFASVLVGLSGRGVLPLLGSQGSRGCEEGGLPQSTWAGCVGARSPGLWSGLSLLSEGPALPILSLLRGREQGRGDSAPDRGAELGENGEQGRAGRCQR